MWIHTCDFLMCSTKLVLSVSSEFIINIVIKTVHVVRINEVS